MFIRPTIISNSEQATALTNVKYSAIWELTGDEKKLEENKKTGLKDLKNHFKEDAQREALQGLFEGKQAQ